MIYLGPPMPMEERGWAHYPITTDTQEELHVLAQRLGKLWGGLEHARPDRPETMWCSLQEVMALADAHLIPADQTLLSEIDNWRRQGYVPVPLSDPDRST